MPAGVDPQQWVSVVTVGYGNRCADAYALMFDGPQRARGSSRAHAEPEGNAPRRAVLVLAVCEVAEWVFASVTSCPPPTRRSCCPSNSKPATTPITVATDAGRKRASTKHLTLGPEKILPPLEALVTAAACVMPVGSDSANRTVSRAAVEVQVP